MRTQKKQDLLESCKQDQFARVTELLNAGVDPRFQLNSVPQNLSEEKDYLTPIGEILKGKHYTLERLQVVRLLLDAGVDVNSPTDHKTDGSFETPLEIVLDRLRNYKKNPEVYQQVVDLLLTRGADLSFVSLVTIYNFVTSIITSKKLLEVFIPAGLNINMRFRGRSLIEQLVFESSAFIPNQNQYEKLQLLITNGADTPNNIPVDSRNIDPRMFNLLIEKSPEIIRDVTLHDVFVLTSPKVLQSLIALGYDINALDDSGYTPLMKCCVLGFEQAAVILMEAGANLDVADANGQTALHHTLRNIYFGDTKCSYISNSRLFIALELYLRGSTPVRDKDDKTPLMNLSSPNTNLVKFCVGEFTQFEAKYLKVDSYKLAVRYWRFYVPNTRQLVEGASSKEKRFSVSIKNGNVISFVEDIVIKTDVDLNLPRTRLIAALENNNLIVARMVIESFPDLDLTTVKNANGYQVLTMLINNTISNSESDCVPLVMYLADKIKSTECNGPLAFALHALGIADNDAKNKNILQIIEQLLLIGFDLNKLQTIGRDGLQLPGWKKLVASELYQNYQVQPGNKIDALLLVICSNDNFGTFLQAVKSNFYIYVNEGRSASLRIYLADILQNLLENCDLTVYSRNRIKHLMLEDECTFDRQFSTQDVEVLENLIRTLYFTAKEVSINLSKEFTDKSDFVAGKRSSDSNLERDLRAPFWRIEQGSGSTEDGCSEEQDTKCSH